MNAPQDRFHEDVVDRAIRCVREAPVPNGPPPDVLEAVLAAGGPWAAKPKARTIRERIFKMNRITRIAAAIAIAAGIAGLFVWLVTGNGVAFADVLEKVRSARTVRFKIKAQVELMPGTVQEFDSDVMVLEPGKIRQTMPGGGVMISDSQQGRFLTLLPGQKKAIVTEATGQPQDQNQNQMTFIEQLRNLQEGSEERLGEEEIDGRTATGFRVRGKEGWDWTIWADAETGLPVRVEVKADTFGTGMPVVMSDFVFGEEMDESLFSLTPPEGYTVREMQVDASVPTEEDLIKALRSTTVMTDGVFPPEFTLNAVTKMWAGKLDKGRQVDLSREVEELFKSLTRALMFVQRLKPENDWHYAGEGVKSGDASKPVCWWRPNGSDYRVIYGDLSVRDVPSENLPAEAPAPE